MVVDEQVSIALNRIADAIEESNDTLSAIASHYDSVVPVMKRNADRVEEAHNKIEKDEFGWGDYLNPKKVFNN